MSYDTFHKIRQLENGDFVVTTRCSSDDAPPPEWVMSYYRRMFPAYTNRQREAAFVLSGHYSGNRYYSKRFKRLERMASEYSEVVHTETGEYPYPIHPTPTREFFDRDIARAKERG